MRVQEQIRALEAALRRLADGKGDLPFHERIDRWHILVSELSQLEQRQYLTPILLRLVGGHHGRSQEQGREAGS